MRPVVPGILIMKELSAVNSVTTKCVRNYEGIWMFLGALFGKICLEFRVSAIRYLFEFNLKVIDLSIRIDMFILK